MNMMYSSIYLVFKFLNVFQQILVIYSFIYLVFKFLNVFQQVLETYSNIVHNNKNVKMTKMFVYNMWVKYSLIVYCKKMKEL